MIKKPFRLFFEKMILTSCLLIFPAHYAISQSGTIGRSTSISDYHDINSNSDCDNFVEKTSNLPATGPNVSGEQFQLIKSNLKTVCHNILIDAQTKKEPLGYYIDNNNLATITSIYIANHKNLTNVQYHKLVHPANTQANTGLAAAASANYCSDECGFIQVTMEICPPFGTIFGLIIYAIYETADECQSDPCDLPSG